jgi:hypothetical protein
MPQDAKCPPCGHRFPVTEARHPFTVACPRCEAVLTVEFKKPATVPEAGQPPYDLLVKPGAAADATAAAPKVRKRKGGDDEERQRGGGSAAIVLLSGGLGLLVVLSGLALTGWFLFTQVDTDDEPVARRSDNRNNNGGNRPNNNPGGNTKGPNSGGNAGGTNKGKKKGNDGGTGFNPGTPAAPKDHFDLRPAPGRPSAIRPPADLDANVPKTILLPGRADAVALGGGGRYIVFHFPEGRLAVFDANTGDIEKEVAADTSNLLAAGADTVVAGSRTGRNRFRTYSLPDLKPGIDFEIPLFHGPRSITVGPGTNGPLLAVDPFGEVALVDVNSGKPVEGAGAKLGLPSAQVRASHDGKLFLAGNGYGPNDKFSLLTESAQKWDVKRPDIAAAYIGPDGKRIYGADQIVTTAGNVVASKPAGLTRAWFVPPVTATGDYFLRVNEARVGTPPRLRNGVVVSLHKGSDAANAVLPAWEGLPETDRLVFGSRTEPLDRHLFLIPEAKLLVILNRDQTKLKVIKLPI